MSHLERSNSMSLETPTTWEEWACRYFGRVVREDSPGNLPKSPHTGKVFKYALATRRNGVILVFKDSEGKERSTYRQIPKRLRPAQNTPVLEYREQPPEERTY